MLTKDQILAATQLPVEEVNVPEWGGTVFVRTMTGTERDQCEQAILTAKEKKRRLNVRAMYAVRTIIDEKGNRLFADNDADELAKTSAKALDRIFGVALRMSGVKEEDIAELEKN
jgi:hypothetical protein